MRRFVLIAVVGITLASGCSASDPGGPSAASGTPSTSVAPLPASIVAAAIAKVRAGRAEISTAFEVHSDGGDDVAITVTGPYDFAHHQGVFQARIASGGEVRALSEILTPRSAFVADGERAKLSDEWLQYARAESRSPTVYRTPANSPETLLEWLAAATAMTLEPTYGSVNGVHTRHFQGLVPVAAFCKVAEPAICKNYRGIVRAGGDDARRIDAYLDDQGRIRRIYIGISDSETVVKTQTEFAPRAAPVPVREPADARDRDGSNTDVVT